MAPQEPPPNGDDDHKDERNASRRLAIGAGVSAAAVLIVSFLQGPPGHIPDIALGWPVVLYIERAGVVAYAIMGLGGIGYRLWKGDQVKQAGGAGAQIGLEETAKSIETLKKAVDGDIRGLSDRVLEVERKVADEGNEA